jgi:hypothetical protein
VQPSNVSRLLTVVAAGLAAALASPAGAHKSSDSYLSLVLEDERITGQWDIALRDMTTRSASTPTKTG